MEHPAANSGTRRTVAMRHRQMVFALVAFGGLVLLAGALLWVHVGWGTPRTLAVPGGDVAADQWLGGVEAAEGGAAPRGAEAEEDAAPSRAHEPLRVYIAPVPAEFALESDEFLFKLGWTLHLPDESGYGPPLDGANPHYRATGQFAGEVLFRNVLASSPLRVDSAEEADIVWVPVGFGLMLKARKVRKSGEFVRVRIERFFNQTRDDPTFLPYLHEKPHVIVIGRIASDFLPNFAYGVASLNHTQARHFLYLTIEQPAVAAIRDASPPMLTIPYPSAVHYGPKWWPRFSKDKVRQLVADKKVPVFTSFAPRFQERKLLVLECHSLGPRRCQFQRVSGVARKYNVREYWRREEATKQAWVSYQARGDSPTRRSIYEAFLTGTVPAVVNRTVLPTLPFADVLDYRKLVVVADPVDPDVPAAAWNSSAPITSLVKYVEGHTALLANMTEAVLRVRHLFQYSLAPHFDLVTPARRHLVEDDDDAFTATLKALMRVFCAGPVRPGFPTLPRSRCS